MQKNLRKNAWTFTVLFLATWISGCGGEEETVQQLPPPPPPPPKPAAVAIPEAKPEAKPLANNRKPSAPATPAIDPADLADTFLAASNQGNFSVLDALETEQFHQSRQDTVISPQPGKNSSSFDILQVPPQNQGNRDPQKRLPPKFVPLPEFGYDASGWPLRIRCEVDQAVMALIPAGVFTFGKSGVGEELGPEHSIYLSPYYIDVHEVTLEQFLKYREAALAAGENAPPLPSNQGSDPNHPALGILMRHAMGYLAATGKELPTEAEWEKAARGASGFDHPWGYGRPAWHQARAYGQISPLMSYPTDQSYYGVFDMAGNAPEWCADWYAPDTHEQALKELGQVPRNWTGPRKAEPQFHRVIKGNSPDWTIWQRSSASMSELIPNISFRGVLRIPE